MDIPAFPQSGLGFPPFVFGVLGTVISGTIRSKRRGVNYKMINGSDVVENEVGKAVYQDFLPQAMEQNRFVPAPEAQVVGKGLEKIQEAMDMCKKGVSAKKLVVTL